jgi:hypothetical protein
MLKKVIVGMLLLSVIGGAALALSETQSAVIEAQTVPPTAAPTTMSTALPTQASTPVPTVGAAAAAPAVPNQPAQNSLGNVGQVWNANGTVVSLSAVGMTFRLNDGSEVFVELGPQAFWGAQGVVLNPGDLVTVSGFFNGDNYHARLVTNVAGASILLRDESGQPLWSGGNSNGANGAAVGQAQVPAEEWVTIDGTVTTVTTNGLSLQTQAGEMLQVSFGQPGFWQTQAVKFAVGDAISMLGFWQGDQFQAGQVIKTATNERIMLRDPNGRPLWAGPGRGETNGAGHGGAGNGAAGGNADAGTGNALGGGNGNAGAGGAGANGGGNGYRGGRTDGTTQNGGLARGRAGQ